MAWQQQSSGADWLDRSDRDGTYSAFYRASPIERVDVVNAGVRAAAAKRFIADLRFDQQVLFDALNLKTSTVNRKALKGESLSREDGERVLGVAKLLGQAEAIVEESGGVENFDAAEWFSGWLCEPVPALGGRRPLDFLGTMEGQALLSQTLAQAQAGVYA